MKRAFLALAFLVAAGPVHAQTQLQNMRWEAPEPVFYPQDSSLSLAIADQTHFGFARVWVALGVNDATGEQVSSTQAAIQGDGLGGLLLIKDGLERARFGETTAQARLKAFQYWRDRHVAPSRAGLFPYQGLSLRWIAFPHYDAAGRSNQCASFVTSGKDARFELAGYWCVDGGRPFTEAEVQSLVGAIGYKDMLTPRPIAVPPGK